MPAPGTKTSRLKRAAARLERGQAVLEVSQAPAAATQSTAITNWLTQAMACEGRSEVFRNCRKLAGCNDFVRSVLYLKKLLFNDGLEFTGIKAGEHERDFRRVVSDLWTEWLVNDNAIAAWTTEGVKPGKLPFVSVVDCENAEYSDAFGVASLRLTLPQGTLTEKQIRQLGVRYTHAIQAGGQVEWGEKPGERYAVLPSSAVHPSGKAGHGLGLPSLWSVIEALAAYGLLSLGEWNAALGAKDVIRHVSKGHSIDSGPLAGLPMHFLKIPERDLIHKGLKSKSGYFDVVKNWDVEFGFTVFDFAFFKEEKWKGLVTRLLRWAGPIGHLLAGTRDGEQDMLGLFRNEMKEHRQAMRRFVQQLGTMTGQGKVDLRWSPVTALGPERLLALVNSATSAGLMSPQTGREYLDLDVEEESKRMREARKNSADFTPVFEAKQGIVANDNPDPATGGRPKETP